MADSPIFRHQKLTILQQIDELKNWHKQQQLKLNPISSSKNIVDLTKDGDSKTPVSRDDNNCGNKTEIIINEDPVSNFDDIPIKGIQPSVHALIENNIPLVGNQQIQTNCNNQKPKFRFLRKGEGIARFRMGPVKIKKHNSNKLNLQPSKISKQSNKHSLINIRGDVHKPEVEKLPMLQPPDIKLNFKNWRSIFNNGNATDVIENAIDNNQLDIFQPNSSIDSSTASIMEKLLALGKKHLKEREEMRVFETIEQHVMDSSFCSTSSYVTKLMENAVMSSTPEKKTSYDCDSQPKQLCQSHVNSKPQENVDLRDARQCTQNGIEPKWVKISDNSITSNEPDNGPTNLDLEQSLHVRFNDEVDYKSFINYSHSINNSKGNDNTNTEQFEQSEEWKDDVSENSSICCSECSCGNISIVNGNNSKHVGLSSCDKNNPQNEKKLPMTNQNPIQILEIEDLEVDDTIKISEAKVSSEEEVSMFSPILNAKLKELENEIEAFRAENNKLRLIREKLEKERKQFQTEKKRFLNEIEEERKKNANYLEEEKQKLAKEKFIFEKYSKNLAKRPQREERKEIQLLREQLNEMKEELNKKESRWGSAQARVRSQVKLLEEDNKKLREEIENLRRQSKSLQILAQKKNKTTINNTKLIHAISEHISSIGPVSEENTLADVGYFNNIEVKGVIVENVDPKTIKSIKVIKEHAQKTPNTSENKSIKSQNEVILTNEEIANTSPKITSDSVSHKVVNSPINRNEISDLEQPKVIVSIPVEDTSVNSIKEIINEDGIVEKIYPDGKKEIRMKNGNIKKIDPVSGQVKTIYFNGDVKELTSNGTVKYYFSESRIWHTTFPDGLEVLDFPNGQVEKRHTSGTVEIIYPSNCKKITYPDGQEEIFYADGTNIKIDGNKKKVLSLPNGQKEIHTDEYVRREYPDGTVKIVYPNGTTETVYANGRVRLKDKHGNLVMDSGNTVPIKL